MCLRNRVGLSLVRQYENSFMDKDSDLQKLLLMDIPLEWQSAMSTSLDVALDQTDSTALPA
jgi:hypothetical protein